MVRHGLGYGSSQSRHLSYAGRVSCAVGGRSERSRRRSVKSRSRGGKVATIKGSAADLRAETDLVSHQLRVGGVAHDEGVDGWNSRRPLEGRANECQRLLGDRAARKGGAYRCLAEPRLACEVGGRPAATSHFLAKAA